MAALAQLVEVGARHAELGRDLVGRRALERRARRRGAGARRGSAAAPTRRSRWPRRAPARGRTSRGASRPPRRPRGRPPRGRARPRGVALHVAAGVPRRICAATFTHSPFVVPRNVPIMSRHSLQRRALERLVALVGARTGRPAAATMRAGAATRRSSSVAPRGARAGLVAGVAAGEEPAQMRVVAHHVRLSTPRPRRRDLAACSARLRFAAQAASPALRAIREQRQDRRLLVELRRRRRRGRDRRGRRAEVAGRAVDVAARELLRRPPLRVLRPGEEQLGADLRVADAARRRRRRARR